MTTSHPHVEIAQRLSACLLEGNVAGVSELYHDDARVWRNVDDRDLNKDQLLKVVRFLSTEVAELAYRDIRVHPTPQGFVQQHVLSGIAPGGESVRVHACLVATIDGGRIRRLEEYLDSAALAPLMKRRPPR